MPLDRLTMGFHILLCSICGFSNILSCRCAFGLASAVTKNSWSGCSERHEDINFICPPGNTCVIFILIVPGHAALSDMTKLILYAFLGTFVPPPPSQTIHVYFCHCTSDTTPIDLLPDKLGNHVINIPERLSLTRYRDYRSCTVLTIATTHFTSVVCLALALAWLPASTRCRRARHAACGGVAGWRSR
jgi:hypothetical protein